MIHTHIRYRPLTYHQPTSFCIGSVHIFSTSITCICVFQACKDIQTDPDFCIVARVEAFIAGWGLDEALRRAEAYRNAGLFHSLLFKEKQQCIGS